MKLTFERLIKFDLLESAETQIINGGKREKIIDFLKILQEIQNIDSFIKKQPSFPGSTDKIIRSELVSAIGATLSIEGTVLNEEEIEESFRKADLKENLKRKEQEAENSRKVYYFIIELVKNNLDDFQYSGNMIKQIHKYFTDNMNYLGNTPGEYRPETSVPSFGYPRKQSLCKTRNDVETAMSNIVNCLNSDPKSFLGSNPIVKAIMTHYYLTEIHPFGDGNGRTARALEALVLYKNNINNYCFWSLANFWSLNRDGYLVHLDNIRQTSSPLDFVLWGIKGYRKEVSRIENLVLAKVKQLMFMDYVRYLLKSKNEQNIKINPMG